MASFPSVAALRETPDGTDLGYTSWHEIDQARINMFAEATGDRQWIHVDPEAAAAGPFGTTIAHGYLTLSLLVLFTAELLAVDNVRMGINYGLNRVRFPAPVPVDSRIRAHGELLSVEDVSEGGVQVTVKVTVEREGGSKPVCVAEALLRLFG
jgi:acyl dehydratase